MKALFARAPQKREDLVRTKARQRVKKLSDEEILNWTDQCGTAVVKALEDFRRLDHPESLREAAQGISALAGVIDELRGRHGV